MAWNPVTQQEDPAYVDPNAPASTGIINGSSAPATPPTTSGVGTTPISAGSVSNQLDTILGGTSPTSSTTPTVSTKPTWEVTAPQTVQGQMAGIIDNKALSPLMERAQAGAAESANARGLINTSMANQAGQAAVMDAALPIATQDAATQAQAAQYNAGFFGQKEMAGITHGYDLEKMAKAQGYNLEAMSEQQKNTLFRDEILQGFDIAKMDKASSDALKMLDAATLSDLKKLETQYGYDIGKMDVKQINDLALMAEDNRNKADMLKSENESREKIAGWDNVNRTDLANIQAKYQTDLGTNKIAMDVYTNTVNKISELQNDPKLDGVTITANGKTAKQNAIDLQFQLLDSSYAVIQGISGIDGIQELLGYDAVGGGAGGGGAGGGNVGEVASTIAATNETQVGADLKARQDAWDNKEQAIIDGDAGSAGKNQQIKRLGPRPTK